jgi:hypothetical protein
MRNSTLNSTARQESMQEWNEAVASLMTQVEDWVTKIPKWDLIRLPAEERVEEIGTYSIPIIEIKTPHGELTLEPIPRKTPGDKIRVYFQAWPTLYRVRLVYQPKGNTWEILTASNVPLRQPWTSDTFFRLAKDLLDIR